MICSRTPCRDLYSHFHFGRCLYHSASGLETLLFFPLISFFFHLESIAVTEPLTPPPPRDCTESSAFATNLTVSFTTVKDDRDVEPISSALFYYGACCCGLDMDAPCHHAWSHEDSEFPRKQLVIAVTSRRFRVRQLFRERWHEDRHCHGRWPRPLSESCVLYLRRNLCPFVM